MQYYGITLNTVALVGLKCSIHTTLEEFENCGLTLRMHEMFSVLTAPESLINATITDYFGFVFEGNSVSENT